MVCFAGELVHLVGFACPEAGGWLILTRLGNSALMVAVPTQRPLGRGTLPTPCDRGPELRSEVLCFYQWAHDLPVCLCFTDICSW